MLLLDALQLKYISLEHRGLLGLEDNLVHLEKIEPQITTGHSYTLTQIYTVIQNESKADTLRPNCILTQRLICMQLRLLLSF